MSIDAAEAGNTLLNGPVMVSRAVNERQRPNFDIQQPKYFGTGRLHTPGQGDSNFSEGGGV